MASPFQQQVRQRKIIYIALIIVLFTASWAWRTSVVRAQATNLAIREEDHGDVELTGAVVRLGLTGSRGLAICILWNTAIEKQKKNQWNELEVMVRSLTKLQPHFITPWLFQSWNLSYNVSVESDRIRDKFFYISRGIDLLAEGERQNRNHPDLRWSIGFYTQHKICQSDETNYQRSLFQLSMIPPNERDPARFWKQSEKGSEFNWAEFHKFVEAHPQLVCRLREGMYQESMRDKKQLFHCETPEAVVQFLQENYQVPSIYRVTPPPADIPPDQRTWNPNQRDELLPELERFPVLPPAHGNAFDKDALASDSTLGDDTDAYAAAHAWYCYAQEPLPAPGPMPGSSMPITDRRQNRMNRSMTTLIFRDYPAQGRRFMAERLQQEGWYDEEPWDVSDWFEQAKDNALAGKSVKVGGGVKWSEDAWRKAALDWRKHGDDNHLIFASTAKEQNTRKLSEQFAKRYGIPLNSMPPRLREEELSAQEKDELHAAQWMFEYSFYRQVSNFEHHLVRAVVEAKPETVACRKLFFRAEQLNLDGRPAPALEEYRTPVEVPAWEGRKLSPLDAWRDLVLLKNKEFLLDSFAQEASAEIQIRYMWLFNRREGKDLKEQIGKAATLLPLVPKFTPDTFRPPIFVGPFDVDDADGNPIVPDRSMQIVLQRMQLPTRRMRPPQRPAPGTGRPRTTPPTPLAQ